MINASPENIPYSLLLLKNLWNDRLYINVKVFTHSTISKINDEAKAFTDLISASSDSQNNRLPILNISLIWKNGKFIFSIRKKKLTL